MKLLLLSFMAVWLLQAPPAKPELNVNEIVSQLGLCSANLTVEQRYSSALKAENEALRKKVAELEKKSGLPPVPKSNE